MAALRFFVNPRTALPIYQQLVDQIKSAAASGMLSGGQQLPSVRELAGQLAINPNTVVRAYSILEAQGVIRRRQGAGTFVAERAAGKSNTAALEQKLTEFMVEAYHQGITVAQVREMVEEAMRRWKIREVD